MPKETFFHLKEEKRQKIEKALKEEFSRTSFEEASISNIIAKANIPRGSFYQYFEDKQDAIEYIMNQFIDLEHQKIRALLIQNQGDIFDTSIKIYEYMVEKSLQEDNFRLMKNILQELRKNNVNIFEVREKTNEKEEIHKLINQEVLNLEEESELFYFLRILTAITRSISAEVISNKISKEQGKERLLKEIEILKRGMLKNN